MKGAENIFRPFCIPYPISIPEEGIPFETGLWTDAVFLQLRNGRHSLYSGYADYTDLYHRMPYRRL